MNSVEQRTGYVAGLRALADLLESRSDIPLPYGSGTSSKYQSDRMTFYVQTKDDLLTLARAFPGPFAKVVDDDTPVYGFTLTGALHGLHVAFKVHRDEVCQRVVTGTREVTTMQPAADAPLIPVTTTVEDVEWICPPLLDEATA